MEFYFHPIHYSHILEYPEAIQMTISRPSFIQEISAHLFSFESPKEPRNDKAQEDNFYDVFIAVIPFCTGNEGETRIKVAIHGAGRRA